MIAYGGGADPYSTIQNMIESGYNGGIWGGTGITSSLAAANIHGTHPLNIGLVDFTPGMNHDATFIVFEGQTITTNAILVRLTYMDDLVLSGDMSEDNATSDALLFAANFGTATTWGIGNLTHANVPNGGDYTSDALLFAANYGVGFPRWTARPAPPRHSAATRRPCRSRRASRWPPWAIQFRAVGSDEKRRRNSFLK